MSKYYRTLQVWSAIGDASGFLPTASFDKTVPIKPNRSVVGDNVVPYVVVDFQLYELHSYLGVELL
jgi:hypothetical protein